MTTDTQIDKFMLVLEDRVFYLGLLGIKMKDRQLGAASIYLAPAGGVRIKGADGQWTRQKLAIVPPYQSHQVVSDCGQVICILIEPERLASGELDSLIRDLNDPVQQAEYVTCMRAAAARLACCSESELSAEEFDEIVFGRPLEQRNIDPRIQSVLDDLKHDGLESQNLATDFAKSIKLSASRFLHLFKEQTGVSFRNYRMWHRARTFLLHANQSNSLTDVALSLGYPDSSHFSHSIRKTYGLQPRSIRIGSQNLKIQSSMPLQDLQYA